MRVCRRNASCAHSSTSMRAKARTALRNTAATADSRVGARSNSTETRNRAATPTPRCPVVPECDAVIVGTGPAGATAADVLTGAGWSVIMLEKGRNHLLDLEPPFAGLGHVSNDEIKFFNRNFLG